MEVEKRFFVVFCDSYSLSGFVSLDNIENWKSLELFYRKATMKMDIYFSITRTDVVLCRRKLNKIGNYET